MVRIHVRPLFRFLKKRRNSGFFAFFISRATQNAAEKKSTAFFILPAFCRLLESRLLHELAAKSKGRRGGYANLLKRTRQGSDSVEDDNTVADGAARHLD